MAKRFHSGPTRGTPVYDELVRALEEEPAAAAPPRLIGATTASGSNTADRKTTDFRNPMSAPGDMIYGGKGGAPRRVAVGTAGQVPRLQPDGVTVSFSDAPTGSGGRYRQYVVVSDGGAGFDLIDDGFGNPVETLETLE